MIRMSAIQILHYYYEVANIFLKTALSYEF